MMTKMMMMMMMMLICSVLFIPVVLVRADYPAIQPTEGFEVDLEPFVIDMKYTVEDDKLLQLQLEDVIRTEMHDVLPNLMGIIFQTYVPQIGRAHV